MSYRPNLPTTIATTTQPGVIKVDGSTITVAADATASVVGTAVTALTDISSAALGGPALSDVDTLNRAGTDYKVTLSARSALFRKNPAGSRTITLVSGATSAILTSTDNDKQIVVTGIAGTLSADGTITDGFRCLVINKTGSPLSLSGIAGLGGTSSLAANSFSQVYMAASSLEVTTGTAFALPSATPAVLGGVKPDGTSLSTTADGTLSVVTITTHALPFGVTVSAADEIATYSSASSSDVKYSLAQISNYSLNNIQNWSAAARPTPAAGQYVLGYNITAGRFEFWNGTVWNQHVRVSDLSATSTQLFGGSGTNGIATAISLGAGLQLSNGTLTSSAGVIPVLVIPTSGTTQTLNFPLTGSRAYDITLTANCVFSASGGAAGELQTLNLIIRGGSGGFSATLPTNIKWKNGTVPTLDTSPGSINLLRIQTTDGGATYAGNF